MLPNECPKCMVGMRPKEDESGEVFLVCAICGYKRKLENVTERVCTECGYGKATMNYIGVIIGDEQPVTLYRCLKCGHVEREGVS